MLPENIRSVLINGKNLETVVFKCAINYSELGHDVWIYSPKQIKELPENISVPNKQVLKLLTFLYLKDYKELLSHLNGVHLWRKIPKVTILTGFEEYSQILLTEYNPSLAAFITASIYDAARVKNDQSNGNNFLIITCDVPEDKLSRLDALSDWYFPNVYNCKSDAHDVFEYVMRILS